MFKNPTQTNLRRLLGNPGQNQGGFTLIEILVTMFILAVGLLGLAGLMFEGMRNNQGAYLRTQASILAYDMADRMRANRTEAESGSYGGFSTANVTSTTLPTCASDAAGCTPANQVTVDQIEWTLQIQGTGADMAMVPGGIGTIAYDAGTNVYTITVQWDEASRAGDAGESITGDNSYSVRLAL